MSTLSNAKMASLKDKLEILETVKEEVAKAEEEVKKEKKVNKVVKK
jgi:hypothetical protein